MIAWEPNKAIDIAVFDLWRWSAREILLYIVLYILQLLFGSNQSRIGKDTVYLNVVQLIINYWSLSLRQFSFGQHAIINLKNKKINIQ